MFFIVSLACHLSALFFSLFKSYTLLYIWRGISGALVTTSLPIFLSILGDIFPNSLRSTASVISSVVVGLGQLMGQTLSGFIGSRFGWRFFFQLTALLGLLSLFILRCTRPPPSPPLVVDFPYNGPGGRRLGSRHRGASEERAAGDSLGACGDRDLDGAGRRGHVTRHVDSPRRLLHPFQLAA